MQHHALLRWFLAVSLLAPLQASADPADRISQAVDDLEALAVELQANQDETAALRNRLVALESLSEEHRQTLADQAQAELRYQASVEELRAQASRSLDLADALQNQLNRERAATAWLWPATLAATGLALIEALILIFR